MVRGQWYVALIVAMLALLALASILVLDEWRRQSSQPAPMAGGGATPLINASLVYVFLKPIRMESTVLLSYMFVAEINASDAVELSVVGVQVPESGNAGLVVRGAGGPRNLTLSLDPSTAALPAKGLIAPIITPDKVMEVRGSGMANDLLLARGFEIYSAGPAPRECLVTPGQPGFAVISGTMPLPRSWAEKLEDRLSSPLVIVLRIEGRSLGGAHIETMGIYVASLEEMKAGYAAGSMPPGLAENIGNVC